MALEQTDLPAERILRTEEEAEQYQREQQQAQAEANMQALMSALASQGMSREQIQQQMLLSLAQLSAAGGGAPRQLGPGTGTA